jgi:hypothetical protein
MHHLSAVETGTKSLAPDRLRHPQTHPALPQRCREKHDQGQSEPYTTDKNRLLPSRSDAGFGGSRPWPNGQRL